MNVLILSVGSLLGQVMLDVLAERRQHLQLMGTNSVPEAPSNFRCDRVFLTPETTHPDFLARFEAVAEQVQPELILPGRDDDVVFLAQYLQTHPGFKPRAPVGHPDIARVCRDKWLSFQWAQERGLPFAASFWLTPATAPQLEAFIQQTGFPMIAKPRLGFGSNGVYFIQSREALETLTRSGELLLQECLGDTAHLPAYQHTYALGMPLFFQVPQFQNHSAQLLIQPDGNYEGLFCAHNRFVLGEIVQLTPAAPPELMVTVRAFADALVQAGWRGPANIAAMPDARGRWKVHEINLRMTGATSLRLACGYDEMRQVFQAFSTFELPACAAPSGPGTAHMVRQPQWVSAQAQQHLKTQQYWAADAPDPVS